MLVTYNHGVFVSRGMKRDFPDDLPPLASFARRPNLRSHCRCQPDESSALNQSGDLICLSPCELTLGSYSLADDICVFAKGNGTSATAGVLRWTFQRTDKQPSRAWEVNEHADWTETRMQAIASQSETDVSSLSSFLPLTPGHWSQITACEVE